MSATIETTDGNGDEPEWLKSAREAIKSVVVSRAFGGLAEEKRDELREDLQHLLDLVTEVHEPRVAIIGEEETDLEAMLVDLLAAGVEGDLDVKSEIGAGRWYSWQSTAGVLHLYDGRGDHAHKAFRYDLPDLVVHPVPAQMSDDDVEAVIDRFLAVDEALVTHGSMAPLVAAITLESRGAEDLLAMRTRDRLQNLSEETGLGLNIMIRRADGELAEQMANLLPQGARFPWARLTLAGRTQARMADRLIGLASSIAATLASVPLPLAATVPITTIQVLMVASIAWLSGRERSLKTVAEFLTAAGLNIGAGYALRELARALVGWIPVAGSVVSAGIAASATVAVGEAAKRYFIGRPSAS